MLPYFLSEGIVYLVMQPREKKSFFLASSKETCGLSGRTNKGKDLKNVPYLFAPLPSQDLVSRDLIAQVSRRPKIPKLGLFDGVAGCDTISFLTYRIVRKIFPSLTHLVREHCQISKCISVIFPGQILLDQPSSS